MSIENDRLIKEETRFQGGYGETVMDTLKLCFWPYRYRVLVLCILGFLGRLLLLGNANLIGVWVDSLCTGPQCSPVPSVFADWGQQEFINALGTSVGIGFLFTLIFRTQFSKISAMAVSQLYDETTFRTSRLPMSFFDRTPVGRLVTRFSSDYGNVFRLFGGPLAEFLSILFDLTCMILLSVLASPLFAPLILLMAFLDYQIFRINQKKLRACRRELSASRSPAVAHFAETTQGSSSIRIFNKSKVFSERFKNLDQYCLSQKKNTVLAILGFSIQMNSLSVLLVGGAGAISIFAHQTGLLSAGDTGVFFAFTALSGFSIQSFFEWMNQVEEALIGVERMDHLLRLEIEPKSYLPPQAKFATGHPWSSDIEAPLSPLDISQLPSTVGPRALAVEFKNVGFRYGQNLPWVLKDVSFKAAAGQRIGIVGRTGAGKSSLIQALFELYPVEQGSIEIGEQRENDLQRYRKQMALISQDTVLFRGTIQENLDVTGLIPAEVLIEALEIVGLSDFASPLGLRAKVDEKGRNLSAGEKQLLCIARCLLQNSPVVVLDEATSSIDPKSEEQVLKAGEKVFEGRTQLIIAHRLSTIENCDLVLWLDEGKVKMFAEPKKVLQELSQSELAGELSEVLS